MIDMVKFPIRNPSGIFGLMPQDIHHTMARQFTLNKIGGTLMGIHGYQLMANQNLSIVGGSFWDAYGYGKIDTEPTTRVTCP